jgi:hypothetical protein
MPKFAVPVSWVESGEYIIEADSEEEAAEKACHLDLPEDPVYSGGFLVHEESIYLLDDVKV